MSSYISFSQECFWVITPGTLEKLMYDDILYHISVMLFKIQYYLMTRILFRFTLVFCILLFYGKVICCSWTFLYEIPNEVSYPPDR